LSSIADPAKDDAYDQ